MPLRDIPQVRFEALASYARHPAASLLAREVRWLADDLEQVLVVILLDTDDEYSAVLMARDLRERYRWIASTDYFGTADEAARAAAQAVDEILRSLDDRRTQGDERGQAVDFFAPVRPRPKLNPSFLRLAESEGYSPARGLIQAMMRWYEDADGNFIEQFQTTGFDTRLWELYLFAVLTESGHVIDQSFTVPDFVVSGPTEFSVEATTINPSQDGREPGVAPTLSADIEERIEYHQEYLPIRYAGPLVAKLQREYWHDPHVEGRPLVLAIQDFHAPMSMTRSRAALPIYLYGYRHHAIRRKDGSLEIRAERVETHRWGSKKVPSGFFALEEAEHISAVLFNSSATISKFNRIGQQAGFGSSDVLQVQRGVRVDHDPNASAPMPFVREVGEGSSESWVEGTDLYHNPRALHPLDHDTFPGAAHHHLTPDGTMTSISPTWHPLASTTTIVVSTE